MKQKLTNDEFKGALLSTLKKAIDDIEREQKTVNNPLEYIKYSGAIQFSNSIYSLIEQLLELYDVEEETKDNKKKSLLTE